jgi:excisionase family DNA binding protein
MSTARELRPPIDIRAAAVSTGLSERFLRRLIAERRIPFIKVAGTRIRFLPSDLDEWLLSQPRHEVIQSPSPVRVSRPLKAKDSANTQSKGS